jgi:hypothetical protein
MLVLLGKRLIVIFVLFYGNSLIFHCFSALLKPAPPLILLRFSFGCMFLSFLIIFNKTKESIPLKVQLKIMKIIVKKRIEFFKITLGDNI